LLLRWISGVDVCAAPSHRDTAASTCHRHARGNRHPRRNSDSLAVTNSGKRHDFAFYSDSIYSGYKNVHAIADIYFDRIVYAQPDFNAHADFHAHSYHNGGGNHHTNIFCHS